MGWFTLLVTLAVLAIPIVIVAKLVRSVRVVSSRLGDPARLQRVFAQTAAAALRRAGADPQAIAKIEVLGEGSPVDRAGELKAAAYEARIGLQRKGRYAAQMQPLAAAAPTRPAAPPAVPIRPVVPPLSSLDDEPLPPVARPRVAVGHALHRPPPPRRQPPVAPLGGFDMGDRFRLSEPPDLTEPQGPLSFDGSWLAVAALLGGVAYYFLR